MLASVLDSRWKLVYADDRVNSTLWGNFVNRLKQYFWAVGVFQKDLFYKAQFSRKVSVGILPELQVSHRKVRRVALRVSLKVDVGHIDFCYMMQSLRICFIFNSTPSIKLLSW